MSLLYEMTKAGKYGCMWFDISNEPPSIIHILIYIKDWGAAIGHLTTDKKAFICSLPHEDSKQYLTIPLCNVSHWAVIPELENAHLIEQGIVKV